MTATLAEEAGSRALHAEQTSALRRLWVLAVPGVVALLAALPGLGYRQLWRDEIATWAAASRPLRGLLSLLQTTDAVLGPYYVFIYGWIRVFGDSEISMRMPSVLAGALAAVVTAAIGRKLFNQPVGLLAGLLVAVMPSVARYGQEARPYAMVTAAMAVATLLVVRAVERPSWKRWLAYSVSVAAVGLLHMVALLGALAHFVYVATAWRRTGDGRQVRWLLAVVGGTLPALPLVWLGLQQSGQVEWIPEATWDSTINEIARVAGSVPVGTLLIGVALLGCWPLARRTGMLGIWALAPFVVLLVLSPVMPLLIHRYVLFTVPAWCLLAAVTVYRHLEAVPKVPRGRRSHLLPALLVALCAAVGVPEHDKFRGIAVPGEPDLRQVVEVIALDSGAGDVLAFNARYASRLRDGAAYYFSQRGQAMPPVAFTAWPNGSPTYPRDCQGCLTSAERVWLISTPPVTDPSSNMVPELAASLTARYEVVRVEELADVTLSLWQVNQ